MATFSGRNNATVLIIGAGVSGMFGWQAIFRWLLPCRHTDLTKSHELGLCTAIDLIRHNDSRDFIIVEKGSQIGGTWNDNKYPGCCCDGKTP
jgi:cation diffusion facilitator CzcD-associated flavoprotein CzcO